ARRRWGRGPYAGCGRAGRAARPRSARPQRKRSCTARAAAWGTGRASASPPPVVPAKWAWTHPQPRSKRWRGETPGAELGGTRQSACVPRLRSRPSPDHIGALPKLRAANPAANTWMTPSLELFKFAATVDDVPDADRLRRAGLRVTGARL